MLVTRVDAEAAAVVQKALPDTKYHALARTLTLERRADRRAVGTTRWRSCQRGTSDLPVAEECAETMRMLGITFERVFDVGVAGIHRLLHKRREVLDRARVVDRRSPGWKARSRASSAGSSTCPVIAVPTSVGYGAAFQGLAALLGMLTSCASGVTVVNIDNGFGAAFAAARILRRELMGHEGHEHEHDSHDHDHEHRARHGHVTPHDHEHDHDHACTRGGCSSSGSWARGRCSSSMRRAGSRGT